VKKTIFAFLFLTLLAFSVGFSAEGLHFDAPLFITSGGQSPGALQMMVLAKAVKLEYVFEKILPAAEFDPSSFKSAMIVVGASGKGLGAAGIDVDQETERVLGIATLCQENGIPLILVQLEGAARRGPSSDIILDALAPFASALFVKADANEDAKFTTLGEEYEIPLVLFEKTTDMRDLLKDYFF